MNRYKAYSKIWFLGLLLVALLTGCARNGGDPGTLVSIKVAPAAASIPVTGILQYSALAIYGDGSARDVTTAATWTSGSSGVTVGAHEGLATGIVASDIPVIITATFNGTSTTASLTVNAATSKGILVTPALASLPVTGTQQYTAIETFSDGSTFDRTAAATWTAVNLPLGGAAVATISSSAPTKGIATADVVGKSTITATFNSLSSSATLTVNAATSKGIRVTPALASLPVTGTQQYTAIETFSDGSTFDRTAVTTWTAPDLDGSGVASILPTGIATGLSVGQATITALFNGKTATAILAVNPTTSVSFTVTPAMTSLPITGTRQYQALETFSDGSTIDRTAVATWTAPDLVGTGVASTLPGGLATANAAGQATITAAYNGKTATANLTVKATTSVSFTVTPATTSLPITGTRQYQALETFSDGSTIDRTAVATWTTPDLVGTGVATISSTGRATANAAGQATVTAKYSSKTATARLTVNPTTSVSFTVTPATASIPISGTRTYTALETFSDGSTADRTSVATWTAPDLVGTGVASISSAGIATGTGAGQATVTAKYNDRTATARLTVNAASSVSFTVTPAAATIPVSGTRQYTALETFSDGSTIDRTAVATWTAPDLVGSGVASILQSGLATGNSAGQATISARYNGVVAIATLTVTAASSVSFTVTPATATIPISGTRQYTALETFSDGSTIDRTALSTWTAPDRVGTGVASILPTGLATGNSAGQANITASYNGSTATARLTVTAASVVSLTVTPATTSLTVSGTRQYTALETYSDGTTADRSGVSVWSAVDSINSGVATILPTGLATATAAGQSTITAIYNGRTATALLIVSAAVTPPPSGDLLSPYGIASYGGITNIGATKINGDVVLDPTASCNLEPILFTDGPGFGLCGGNITNIPLNNASDKVVTPTYPDTTTSASVMIALTAKWITYSPAGKPGATVLGCGTIGNAGEAGAGIGCSGNPTLPPGTYISSTNSTIGIAGDLTLDAAGDANAVWVFQAPSALTTAVGSKIILTGGAKASNIWWYVGSSASLLGNTIFQGNILASASITMGTGATSCGRLLAGAGGSGAFTFLNNTVSVPGHTNAPADCL